VVGKTRGDDQVPQGCSGSDPSHQQRRTQKGENEKQQIVTRIPGSQTDNGEHSNENCPTGRHFDGQIKSSHLHMSRTSQRGDDENEDQSGDDQRQ
jgi:hypothetical protein